MKKDDLRSVSFPDSGEPAKFHIWLIQESSSQTSEGKTDILQHAVALVELSTGKMREVKANDITFLD